MIYLDNAATTACLPEVWQAMQRAYASYGSVHRSQHPYSEATTYSYENARVQVADFIGAQKEEIIFTSGTTDSINRIARGWGDKHVGPEDEVVITAFDHNSNYLPWKALCERTGAKLRILSHEECFGEITLGERTKIVAFPLVCNVDGTQMPITNLAQAARKVGAVTVLDAAQGLLYWQDIVTIFHESIDFVAFSGHKLHGPTGIGVLFAKHEMTPVSFGAGPLKMEVGTPPVIQAIGLGAACQFWQRFGTSRIQERLIELEKTVTRNLRAMPGVEVVKQSSCFPPGIVAFTMDGFHPHDIATELGNRGICIRGGRHCNDLYHDAAGISATCRISFSVFNTLKEIDVFIDALKDLQRRGLFHANL